MQTQLVECYAKRKTTDKCAISGFTDFNGKEWSNIYPWNEINPETGEKYADGENKCYYNGELIDMQLYVICAPGNKGYNFWQNLRDKKVY